MIRNKKTFFLGVFIFLIPYLGLPSSWKTALVIVCGVLLSGMSVKFSIPKKIPKRIRKKEKVTPVYVENSPMREPNMSSDIVVEPKQTTNLE